MSKKSTPQFVYLVQGTLINVVNFQFLQKDNSDLILLSYDKQITDCPSDIDTIYLPSSTWAEGRNKLLEAALLKDKNYLYYVFLDDDVEIVSGSFEDFEDMLIEYTPMMGVPLGDQIKESFRFNPSQIIHHPVAFDQIVQAYHRNVVRDKIALPYETSFDSSSWWYACQINQYLTLRYYRGKCAQFNSFEIRNSAHKWGSDKIENSIYRSGVTREGLKQCSRLIQDNFGIQPKLINSLFHPRFSPKERYSPSLSWVVSNHKKLTKIELMRKIASIVISKISKIYYKARPSENLITYEEFLKNTVII